MSTCAFYQIHLLKAYMKQIEIKWRICCVILSHLASQLHLFQTKLSTSSQSFLQPNAQLIETFTLVMIDQINVLMILHLWLSCLTLRHGQESVERGFSVNKAIIIDNISPGCIVGKGLVRDYMLTNTLKPLNVQITSNLKVPF